jgi:hypothetical protein
VRRLIGRDVPEPPNLTFGSCSISSAAGTRPRGGSPEPLDPPDARVPVTVPKLLQAVRTPAWPSPGLAVRTLGPTTVWIGRVGTDLSTRGFVDHERAREALWHPHHRRAVRPFPVDAQDIVGADVIVV